MKPKETHKQDLQGKKGGTREGRGERKGKEKKNHSTKKLLLCSKRNP